MAEYVATETHDQPPDPHEPYLTLDDVGAALRVSRHTVKNWVDDGTLDAHRLSQRTIRIDPSELREWLGARHSPAPVVVERLPTLYGVDEVAAMLKVSDITLRRWVKKGVIPAYHLPRPLRFSQSELIVWLNSCAYPEDCGVVLDRLPTLWLLSEIAELLQVSRMTVSRWCATGLLPGFRPVRYILVNEPELLAFLEECRIPACEGRLTEVPDSFITIKQAADSLNAGTRAVSRWIDQEGLPAYRMPAKVLIARNELQDWLEERRV